MRYQKKKNDKTNCSTNRGEEYSFWIKVIEFPNPPKQKRK